ncbi:Sec-independent protein translocase protein TatB [Loktanella sp. DJP18]|uniref:Sec-independent protein translocase protein TatB n=1 Tax=Loktanella sp. DJP18 TaxID=3409788 RepID=UPI003BB5F409
MFGLGWSEMILIGIVALIVIGPKDLPNMFRELGRMTGKARQMASEFQRAMESAADDSGVKDISKSIKAAANPAKFGTDKIKQSVGMTHKPGSETAKLSEERQVAKDKIAAATARVAEERRARELAAADAAERSEEPDAETVASAPPAADAAVDGPEAAVAAPKASVAAPKSRARTATATPKPAKPRAKKAPAGDA